MQRKWNMWLGGLLLLCSSSAWAEAPGDYYEGLDTSNPVEFTRALGLLISEAEVVPYSSSAFDVHDAINILDASPDLEGHVELLYSDDRADMESWPGYNREHVWPQSLGAAEGSPAHSDLHHIFACDSNVNSSRGNKPFGECEGECSSHPEAPEAQYDAVYWEPPVEDRGDLARVLLYMAVRYEGHEDEPDLRFVESGVEPGCDCMSNLETLLAWHRLDPVDAREAERNDTVFELQGNRNPFVDHPEWVRVVYGSPSELSHAPVAVVPEVSIYVGAISEKEGHIVERFGGAGVGGAVETESAFVVVGDDARNRESRGFFAFDTSMIPEGAEIVSATLHITPVYQSSGTFDALGTCVVELARGFFGRSDALTRFDWQDQHKVVEAGSLNQVGPTGETVPVSIDPALLAIADEQDTLHFRLRFEGGTDGDQGRDAVIFASTDHINPFVHPVLELRIQP